MADGVNHVVVGGNLGDDPAVRVTQSGTTVMTLSIGCNSSYLDRNRVRQEKVEWVRVVVFGRRAEGLAKFLRKGAKVFVEGSLQTSSWEDNSGTKRFKTEVVARNVYLGGSNNPRGKDKMQDPERRRPNRRDDDQDYPPDSSAPSQGGGYDDGGGEWNRPDDEDVPF